MRDGRDGARGFGGGLTADDIRDVAFGKPPLGRSGYAQDAVDAFLDRIEGEFRSGRFTLTAADIREIAFARPRFGRRGYNEEEVDAFLDLIETEIRRRGGR
ncbi:divIVA domain-containing protein [Nocardia nova SH22a]|uniref:Cell wall synthesis protein Wag31 n=1 Tax=Nocardia nova SH22a TaxID=1415166 RepID=W5TCD6_9NOCA|nr:DivIVA domain-containing protein [Nocardia nova]AHH17010.1 divIVA domain-containing protein [Nocardia nova SH22a]